MRNAAGADPVWLVSGTERPPTTPRKWRDRLLEVVDMTYEMFSLQAQVASHMERIATGMAASEPTR
jgi:hypothetical protein